jgi:hypothetical protein
VLRFIHATAHGPQDKVRAFVVFIAYVEAPGNALYGMPAQLAPAGLQCPLQFVIGYALPEKYGSVGYAGMLIVEAVNCAWEADQDTAI